MRFRLSRIRPATRRRLFWLAALLSLWQQVAMAAYVCTMPADAMADGMHAAMARTCPEMRSHAGHALCLKHCAPDTSVQPDARTPNVPASLLPALVPTMLAAAPMSSAHIPPRRAGVLPDASPPVRLLFCSLLI